MSTPTPTNPHSLPQNLIYATRPFDGRSIQARLVTVAGEQTTLQLETPLAVADAPEGGEMYSLGLYGQETVERLLKAIKPGADLSARLTLVPHAPAVYLSDQQATPPFDAETSLDPAVAAPASVVALSLSESVRSVDDTPVIELTATWTAPNGAAARAFRVYTQAGNGSFEFRGETTSRRLTFSDDWQAGERVTVAVVAVGFTGESLPLARAATATWTVRTNADLLPPPTPLGFAAEVLGETALLSWHPLKTRDLSHYVIRYSPEVTGATWERAGILVQQVVKTTTQVTVAARAGTYLIKAVDVFGIESQAAAAVTTSVPQVVGNQVAVIVTDPDFDGEKIACAVVADKLQLIGVDDVRAWPDVRAVGDVRAGLSGLAPSGTYTTDPVDLGAVYTAIVSADLVAYGSDIYDDVRKWLDVRAVANVRGASAQDWAVNLEVRTTSDDPDGSPAWSAWQPLRAYSRHIARGYQFRAVLTTNAPNITPQIEALTFTIDLPDRTVSGGNIACSSAGMTVLYPTAFWARPTLGITAENMATGDTYELKGPGGTGVPDATGFFIRFLDSGGSGVARTFDYLARGVGQQGS